MCRGYCQGRADALEVICAGSVIPRMSSLPSLSLGEISPLRPTPVVLGGYNASHGGTFPWTLVSVFFFFFLHYAACGILVPTDWTHGPCMGSMES